MTSFAFIYLPYLVPIDCSMFTCACTYAKLSKRHAFIIWGQIFNTKTIIILGHTIFWNKKYQLLVSFFPNCRFQLFQVCESLKALMHTNKCELTKIKTIYENIRMEVYMATGLFSVNRRCVRNSLPACWAWPWIFVKKIYVFDDDL